MDSFFQISQDVLDDFRASFDYARQEVDAWKKNLEQRFSDSKFQKYHSQNYLDLTSSLSKSYSKIYICKYPKSFIKITY